jgi:glycerol-3-phosphate acyltransferase PlsX
MKKSIPTIAVDAMGGDYAPGEIVKGIAAATHEHDARFVLVGDSRIIKNVLDGVSYRNGSIEIEHTDEFIGMDELLPRALSEKPNASIARAARLVKEDTIDAMLSAGNTGGLVMAAAKHIPMIEGVERSALAAVIPTRDFKTDTDGISLILDVGATVGCNVKHLVHFAIMGTIYAREILNISDPRVGLLNNGTEETKGGPELRKVYKLLKEVSGLRFAGNIEGSDIVQNAADVIVCEGMAGNIIIKLMEGIADSLFELGKFAAKKNMAYFFALGILRSGLKKLKKKIDYAEYGGAPLLGFQHLCIKAHGKSKAKAVKNAAVVAVRSAQDSLCEKIRESVLEFNTRLPLDSEPGL